MTGDLVTRAFRVGQRRYSAYVGVSDRKLWNWELRNVGRSITSLVALQLIHVDVERVNAFNVIIGPLMLGIAWKKEPKT